MSIVKQILRFAAPMKKIEEYDRYLFIGPHPDDIEIGAGALAAKLAAMEKEVIFCICTDGRYGNIYLPSDVSKEDVIKIRRRESLRSAACLGVSEVRFLELSDGGFYSQSELEKRMADVIGETHPDVIIAPDPCVSSECHTDHLKAGRAARKLACFAPFGGIMEKYGNRPSAVKAVAFYMTDKPNTFVNTTGFLKEQLRVLSYCFPSQYPIGGREVKDLQLYLKLRALENGVRAFGRTGEAYRYLDQLHMHCMPEASE